MASGIYAILNSENGKVYIGSSTSLNNRRNSHFRSLEKGTHSNSYLQNAVNKYGLSKFKFIILNKCVGEKLLKMEQYYIDLFKSSGKAYNLRILANSNIGRKLSEETKQKLREAHLGKKLSEETKRKIGNAGKGHTVTEETKRKISNRNKGKPSWGKGIKYTEEMKKKYIGHIVSEETRKKIGDAHRGKKLSEEHIQKLKEVNTGLVRNNEFKRKVSKAMAGRAKSEETKRKMSEASKGKGLGRKLSELTKKRISDSLKNGKRGR